MAAGCEAERACSARAGPEPRGGAFASVVLGGVARSARSQPSAALCQSSQRHEGRRTLRCSDPSVCEMLVGYRPMVFFEHEMICGRAR